MPSPFLVMATQNPIESEGTYPLPEAQVDRFMLKIVVDYPARGDELTVIERALADPRPGRAARLGSSELAELQAADAARLRRPGRLALRARARDARRASLGEHGLEELAQYVAYGASPRGPINLVLGARALALLRGRRYVAAAGRPRAREGRAPPPAWCSATRRWPRASTPTRSSTACSRRSTMPHARPRARGRRRDRRSRALAPRAHARPARARGRLPGALLRHARPDGARGGSTGCSRATTARGRSATAAELAQVRPYVPGDDVRRIDWNVTARTGEPHVRVARRRARGRDVARARHLGLDDVRHRRPAQVGRRRGRRARASATSPRGAATGSASSTFGDRVADDLAAARRAAPGLLALLLALRREPDLEPAGPTSLGAALGRIGRLARRRSVVVVVSDFRGPRDWRPPLLQLAARHDVVAVEIRDPREQELPDVGDLWLVDPETGRQLRVDTRSREAARALRERRPPPTATRSRASCARSASRTSCSRPRATGCGRSSASSQTEEEAAMSFAVAARAARPRCSSRWR